MRCSHCSVEFHSEETIVYLPSDSEGEWFITSVGCPNPKCLKNTFRLINNKAQWTGFDWQHPTTPDSSVLIRPHNSGRPVVPIEVSTDVATDYNEACLVLNDSPKPSSALSRRCLQNLLLEKAGVVKGDLSSQIQSVIDSKQLPGYLAEQIDAVRNIGNFAAHPNKSKTTGEILEVEPQEAEWNLEVLESLFDFYYVRPEKARSKKEALNAKLLDSGKPPMK